MGERMHAAYLAAMNAATAKHFSERTPAEEKLAEAFAKEREAEKSEWIEVRTIQILNDKGYFDDLMTYVMEDHSASVWALKDATVENSISALADFQLALSEVAHGLAVSEANVRWPELAP